MSHHAARIEHNSTPTPDEKLRPRWREEVESQNPAHILLNRNKELQSPTHSFIKHQSKPYSQDKNRVSITTPWSVNCWRSAQGTKGAPGEAPSLDFGGGMSRENSCGGCSYLARS
jgi:hypothetical protein